MVARAHAREATVVIVSSVNAFESLALRLSTSLLALSSFQSGGPLECASCMHVYIRGNELLPLGEETQQKQEEERYIILRFVTILFIPCHERARTYSQNARLSPRARPSTRDFTWARWWLDSISLSLSLAVSLLLVLLLSYVREGGRKRELVGPTLEREREREREVLPPSISSASTNSYNDRLRAYSNPSIIWRFRSPLPYCFCIRTCVRTPRRWAAANTRIWLIVLDDHFNTPNASFILLKPLTQSVVIINLR